MEKNKQKLLEAVLELIKEEVRKEKVEEVKLEETKEKFGF
jgi:hypothetical protein